MKKIDVNKNYKETELAYMAGIIDGEGSISVTDLSKKYNRSFFITNVGVSSTDKVLIEWIIDVFGGWMSEYTPKQTPINSRKKVYRWQITGENLETLLNLIKPYVVIKKKEIEIMLKIRSTFTKGCKKIPIEIHKVRTAYSLELKTLHCRAYK